jgi:glycerol-3-phosphate dehydrogenase
VVLVESHDFAKGTSSRATKLVHGGVRYLAQGNIALVREALHERTTLLHNAPHLAQPLPFVMPSYQLVGDAVLRRGPDDVRRAGRQGRAWAAPSS